MHEYSGVDSTLKVKKMSGDIPNKVKEKLGEEQILIRVETYRPESKKFYDYQIYAYIHPSLRGSRYNEINKCFCRYVSGNENLETAAREEVRKFERHMEKEESPVSGTPYWRASYAKHGNPEFITETQVNTEKPTEGIE